MLKKLKKLLLTGPELARYYEEIGEFDNAVNEYLKLDDHKKAGEILEKQKRWHEAANLYISKNNTDSARKAVEQCFRQNNAWEIFEPQEGKTISIEDWLKKTRQTRRFVTYIRYVETLNHQEIPITVVLANKLKQVSEFKSAGELYRIGFDLVNKGKEVKSIKNEEWIGIAAECFAKAGLYDEAAECLKHLTITEVNIGEEISKGEVNPYRNFTHNLTSAKQLNILDKLVDILGEFDPFNIAYDLLKMGEFTLSIKVFFQFYGKVLKRKYNETEIERRNQRIQYCLNQYVIFYSRKGLYERAGEIALMNSQKEIAADLFKKAKQEKEAAGAPTNDMVKKIKAAEKTVVPKEEKPPPETLTSKCSTCGEPVGYDWEVCPNCDQVLELYMCSCGQKLKRHWKRCPNCQKVIPQEPSEVGETFKKITTDDDTKPYKTFG
jgi:tetratricopeptide (TPR) repeat protein